MCIAVPMKIIEIDSLRGKARAVYQENELEIDTRLVAAQAGEFVLVHAGCAIEIIRESAADELNELINELEALTNNGNE